jgi:hypothetical protein
VDSNRSHARRRADSHATWWWRTGAEESPKACCGSELRGPDRSLRATQSVGNLGGVQTGQPQLEHATLDLNTMVFGGEVVINY